MLVNILKKITTQLSYNDFIHILYKLIQFECGRQLPLIDLYPYNELKPILNEHYTTTVINNLANKIYSHNEIANILGNLYEYSIVSNILNVVNLNSQPHVKLNINQNGEYIYSYKTFNDFDYKAKIRHMNSLQYIKDPMSFIEEKCTIDVTSNSEFLNDMERLYSPEKCDQYLATKTLWNQLTSTPSNSNPVLRPQTANLNKKSRDFWNLSFVIGYYFYGLNSSQSHYTFDT